MLHNDTYHSLLLLRCFAVIKQVVVSRAKQLLSALLVADMSLHPTPIPPARPSPTAGRTHTPSRYHWKLQHNNVVFAVLLHGLQHV